MVLTLILASEAEKDFSWYLTNSLFKLFKQHELTEFGVFTIWVCWFVFATRAALRPGGVGR
jgi:hypothetical protein